MCREFKVVLIDAKEYFEYFPGICRAYGDPREHRKLSQHYLPVCDALAVEFVWGEVLKLDLQSKILDVKEMACDCFTRIKYDYLVVTAGTQYGIQLQHKKRVGSAVECLWYPTALADDIEQSNWKGLDERYLVGRRKHLENEYDALCELNKQKATIMVIGAGFVGIEFATEVKYFFPDISVVITESRDKCIGTMPPACIKYVQNYLDKNGIRSIYNVKYDEFLESASALPRDISAENAFSASDSKLLDKLPDMCRAWGVPEPSRIYMAVGVRAVNQFMPDDCVTPKRAGGRGGYIVVDSKQQVLQGGKVLPDVFAAGNCCQPPIAYPKNSFPAEAMAAVACHNIRVTHGLKGNGGCFSFCRPKKMKEMHWELGIGLCATSLGPHDAAFVAGGRCGEPGSGYTVLTGHLSALNKEFIRWSKVDQIRGGCIGALVWKLIH